MVEGYQVLDEDDPHEKEEIKRKEAILEKRRRREKEIQYEILKQNLFRELLTYIPFLVLFIFYVVSSQNTVDSFQIITAMREAYVDEEIQADVHGNEYTYKKNLLKVGNVDELFAWLNGPFLDSTFPQEHYNGDPTSFGDGDTGTWVYQYNKLLWGVQIRTVRVGADCTCEIPEYARSIYPANEWRCFGPLDYSGSEAVLDKPDIYLEGDVDGFPTFPFLGSDATTAPTTIRTLDNGLYPGSGQSAVLETYAKAREVLGKLPRGVSLFDYKGDTSFCGDNGQIPRSDNETYSFIDESTRALFVDLNVLNPNVNLIGVVRFLFEFGPGGRILVVSSFKTMTAIQDPPFGTWQIVKFYLQFVIFGYILYYLGVESGHVKRAFDNDEAVGTCIRNYFNRFSEDIWNLVDVLNLLIFLIALIMRVVYLIKYQEFFNGSYLSSPSFINMQGPSSFLLLENSVNSFNVLISSLKIFKFLRLNYRMSLLWLTVTRATQNIKSFGMMFLFVFFGFALMSYMLFGNTLEEFKSLVNSTSTLFFMVIGEFNYENMRQANPVIAPVFFFAYMILVFFILMNMFLAIISEAYIDVQKESRLSGDRKKNDVKFMKRMWTEFKSCITRKPVFVDMTAYEEEDELDELELRQRRVPKQNYQVVVHVLDVARLITFEGKDAVDVDPVVSVEILAEKHSSAIYSKTCFATFDHTFFFNLEVTEDEFNAERVTIAICDGNTKFRSHIIGMFEIELVQIYVQRGHEMFQQWVALTDPHTEEIQGFLKVSLAIKNERDYLVNHRPEDFTSSELEPSNANSVILPYFLSHAGCELRVNIYRAESLPVMDIYAACDAFVSVQFAGNAIAKTKIVKNSLHPVWNEEVRLPVLVPTMADTILVDVFDWDEGAASDELVGSLYFSFKEIQEAAVQPTWFCLYGPPEAEKEGGINASKRRRSAAGHHYAESVFKGRILLSIAAVRANNPKARIKATVPCHEPASQSLSLRIDVYDVSNLPIKKKTERVAIEVSWGTLTQKTRPVMVDNGVASFSDVFEDLTSDWPDDMDQVADIFFNLIILDVNKEKDDPEEAQYRAAFARVPVKSISGVSARIQWALLRYDYRCGKSEWMLPGVVNFRAFVVPSREIKQIPRVTTHQATSKPYEFRASIYMGRELAGMDGITQYNVYCLVHLCGTIRRTSTVTATGFPRWFETLQLPVDLPTSRSLLPNIRIEVWAEDPNERDLFLGMLTYPTWSVARQWQGDPVWQDLYFKDPSLTRGALLVSFELIPESDASQQPPDISPQVKECTVDLTINSLRQLSALDMLPIEFPYIEVNFDDDIGNAIRTRPVKIPSGDNPNVFEVLQLKGYIPVNPLYAPVINFKVYDHRTAYKDPPLIANLYISLADFLPWTDVKIQKEMKKLDAAKERVAAENRAIEQMIFKSEEYEAARTDEIPSKIEDVNETPGNALHFESGYSAQFFVEEEKETEDRSLPEIPDFFPTFEDEEENDEDSDADTGKREACNYELELMLGGSAQTFEEIKLQRIPKRDYHYFRLLRNGKDPTAQPSVAGIFRGRVRILEESSIAITQREPTFKFNPRKYAARAYILRCIQLGPADYGVMADPYVKITFGPLPHQSIRDLSNKREDTLDPEFFRCYEVEVDIPGDSVLQIDVIDGNKGADPIGGTKIDLENRLLCQEWRRVPTKPKEIRTLFSPFSHTPQGKLEMWLEILPLEKATQIPKTSLALLGKGGFELRVVIWSLRLVTKDKGGKDVVVSGTLKGQPKQKTDPYPRFYNVWNRDLMDPDDFIAEVNVNLRFLFKRVVTTGLSDDTGRLSLTIHHPEEDEPLGQIDVSIELLPEGMAMDNPVGRGREEPNQHPFLPDPAKGDDSADGCQQYLTRTPQGKGLLFLLGAGLVGGLGYVVASGAV